MTNLEIEYWDIPPEADGEAVRGRSSGPPRDRFLSGDRLAPLLDDDQAKGYAPTPVGHAGWRPSDGHMSN